jgi:hypothetical protein
MTKYRVCAALLAGVGFVSVLCLLLNIPAANFFSFVLLVPGGAAITVLKLGELHSIAGILGASVIIYSTLAFCLILFRFRSVPNERFRQRTLRIVLPVLVISSLASFPKLNPILPVGMAELARQEGELQQALNPSVKLEEARSILRNRGIDFGEDLQQTGGLVFDGPNKRITSNAGDRVLTSRWQTSARSFPCGYDMEIILLFGPDDKLKDRYINRFPICP